MTVQELVYARLRQALITGGVEPGVLLTLRGLASAMSVSVTPVREAVRRLGTEHALVIEDNRRIYVPAMTPVRFQALVELRKVVESHAAVTALPWVNRRLLDKLVAYDGALDSAVESEDLDAMMIQNQHFHRTLYQANPDSVAQPMVESLWLQLGPFLRLAARHVRALYTVDYHAEMLQALRAGDEVALQEALRNDIDASAACLDAGLLDSLTRRQARAS